MRFFVSLARPALPLVLGMVLASSAGGAPDASKKEDAAKGVALPKGGDKSKASTPLGKLAESQKDPARERLDAAIRLTKSEDYASAAVQLHELLGTGSPLEEEAEYNLAKTLYRLSLYHSALHHFAQLLAKGPKSRFHGAALEWCLFISRKIVGDDRVHDAVARYATSEFPKEYRDEFHFYLARFHYLRALALESAGIAGTMGEARVKETATGGKSFGGDIFGEDESGKGAAAAGAEGEKTVEGAKAKSFDEDIFGFEETSKEKKPEKADKEKPEKAGKKDRKKDKKEKRGKKEGEKEEAKREEAKPDEKKEPPPPPPEDAGKKDKKEGDAKFVLTSKEHVEAASKNVLLVSAESRFGARAKFLEGLILYKQGRENDALESFKSVVRLTRTGQPYADDRLRELAFFQLARTHFGAKQPSYSIFYYDKVDRDSYAWLDAIYESSWAEFRLGNYEKALGNLLTLHSPFFKDEYYPESLILKAVIYYENCHYSDAKAILTEFLKRYEPVHEELKKLTERDQPPAKYYEALADLRGGEGASAEKDRAGILGQLLTIALGDQELRRLDAAYREVDGEIKAFASQAGGFGQSRLAAELTSVLSAARDDLARDAGRAVKRTLEKERDAIQALIQQSVRIDIETSRAEQERMEASLRDIRSDPKNVAKEFIEWADDERIVWPFTGEYWRDELGTYELTLANTCQTDRAGE